MRVAIPRMGEMVAPCFEHCSTMAVFEVGGGGVEQTDYPLRSREPFDRVRLLRDRRVTCLICGGMQDVYEDVVRASGIEVISWVSGEIEAVLASYRAGRLEPGAELETRGAPGPLAMDRREET